MDYGSVDVGIEVFDFDESEEIVGGGFVLFDVEVVDDRFDDGV